MLPQSPLFQRTFLLCALLLLTGWGGLPARAYVNSGSGVEEYQPPADLVVFNPHGPPVVWTRKYRTLAGLGRDQASGIPNHQNTDFGNGWTHRYNANIYDADLAAGATTARPGNKTLTYPDGAEITFQAPAVPTAAAPTVHCILSGFQATTFLIDWHYDPKMPLGTYTITFVDRAQWTFSCLDAASQAYVPTRIADAVGSALDLKYAPGHGPKSFPLLARFEDAATGKPLVTIARDSAGAISALTDCYGRAVFYHVGSYPTEGVPPGFTQAYPELDRVSQVVPAGTDPEKAPERSGCTYQNVFTGLNAERVPFLHSVLIASPAGPGLVAFFTNTYDALSGDRVQTQKDARGNTLTFSYTDAVGNAVPAPDQGEAGYAKTVKTDAQGRVLDASLAGFGADGNQTSGTGPDGKPYHPPASVDSPDPGWTAAQAADQARTEQPYWDTLASPSGSSRWANDQFAVFPERDPNGTYDTSAFALGELTSLKDSKGRVTRYTYAEPSGEPLTTVTQVTPGSDEGAATLHFTYDALGSVLSVQMGARTVTYNYTSDGAYTQAALPDRSLVTSDGAGGTYHYRYDARGNLAEQTLPSGERTTYEYSLADRLTHVSVYAAGAATPTEQVAYTYHDLHGLLSRIVATNGLGKVVREYIYRYDVNGNLISATGTRRPATWRVDGLDRRTLVLAAPAHPSRPVRRGRKKPRRSA